MVLTVFTTLFSLITNLDIQSDFINFNLCKFLVVDTMWESNLSGTQGHQIPGGWDGSMLLSNGMKQELFDIPMPSFTTNHCMGSGAFWMYLPFSNRKLDFFFTENTLVKYLN